MAVPGATMPHASIPSAAGSYPARAGNRVTPLIDGVPTFRRIGVAIRAARRSIWLTVTFYADDFRFPDGGGLFDDLDEAVARGVDVRILFWRASAQSSGYGRTFAGSAADRAMLRARGSGVSIRWDCSPDAYCQHQKSWLIDAGEPGETAFVGGINLTAANLGIPGHAAANEQRHDVYLELTGPSATDVHHNSVQRWNEASERTREDGLFGAAASTTLRFPGAVSPPCGPSVAQVQRMVPPGRYGDGTPAPDAAGFPIVEGERSILDQYLAAIAAARRSIYIENQALPVPAVADRLTEALRRGVEIVYLCPAEPEAHVRTARRDPAKRAWFEQIAALGSDPGFTLAGLVAPGPVRRAVYVHAKIMVVDQSWATIGSCNLHSNSLSGNTELNVAIWDPDVARQLRSRLMAEHLGHEVDEPDDLAALRLFRRSVLQNYTCLTQSDPGRTGLAVWLDAALYGQ